MQLAERISFVETAAAARRGRQPRRPTDVGVGWSINRQAGGWVWVQNAAEMFCALCVVSTRYSGEKLGVSLDPTRG